MVKSLEELTFNEGKIVNSSGSKVDAAPVGAPVILSVNERFDIGNKRSNNEVEAITKNAPDDANAYMKGQPIGAAVVRAPYWDNLPVQFYKV